jgi:hypothetical protein
VAEPLSHDASGSSNEIGICNFLQHIDIRLSHFLAVMSQNKSSQHKTRVQEAA